MADSQIPTVHDPAAIGPADAPPRLRNLAAIGPADAPPRLRDPAAIGPAAPPRRDPAGDVPRHPLTIRLVDRHPLGIRLVDLSPPPDPATFIPRHLRDSAGDVPRSPRHHLVAIRPVDGENFLQMLPVSHRYVGPDADPFFVNLWKNLSKNGYPVQIGAASLPQARETSVSSFPVGGTAADMKSSSFPADVKDHGCYN